MKMRHVPSVTKENGPTLAPTRDIRFLAFGGNSDLRSTLFLYDRCEAVANSVHSAY